MITLSLIPIPALTMTPKHLIGTEFPLDQVTSASNVYALANEESAVRTVKTAIETRKIVVSYHHYESFNRCSIAATLAALRGE